MAAHALRAEPRLRTDPGTQPPVGATPSVGVTAASADVAVASTRALTKALRDITLSDIPVLRTSYYLEWQ
jgi:hypothetical protein